MSCPVGRYSLGSLDIEIPGLETCMSVNPQTPQPAPPPVDSPAGTPVAADPDGQRGTSGLAIAGLVLAFLAAPIGFVLSLVALFQTGKGRQKGRGLAVAGVVVSVLAMVSVGVVVAIVVNTVGDKVSTIADPGCTTGKAAVLDNAAKMSDPASVRDGLQATVDGLASAEAKAKHDDVRNAVKTLGEDYQQLLQAIDAGTVPPEGLQDKIDADAETFDGLCTIGADTE